MLYNASKFSQLYKYLSCAKNGYGNTFIINPSTVRVLMNCCSHCIMGGRSDC